MKYCAYCGKPMEDADGFCAYCGKTALESQQPQYPQAPYGYAPAAPYNAPILTVGIACVVGSVAVWLFAQVLSLVMLSWLGLNYAVYNIFASVINTAIYVGICFGGMAIYNSQCKRRYHYELVLSSLWVLLPVCLRYVVSFLLSLLSRLVYGIFGYSVGLITVLNIVTVLMNAGITAVLTCVILKAYLNNKRR